MPIEPARRRRNASAEFPTEKSVQTASTAQKAGGRSPMRPRDAVCELRAEHEPPAVRQREQRAGERRQAVADGDPGLPALAGPVGEEAREADETDRDALRHALDDPDDRERGAERAAKEERHDR